MPTAEPSGALIWKNRNASIRMPGTAGTWAGSAPCFRNGSNGSRPRTRSSPTRSPGPATTAITAPSCRRATARRWSAASSRWWKRSVGRASGGSGCCGPRGSPASGLPASSTKRLWSTRSMASAPRRSSPSRRPASWIPIARRSRPSWASWSASKRARAPTRRWPPGVSARRKSASARRSPRMRPPSRTTRPAPSPPWAPPAARTRARIRAPPPPGPCAPSS